MRPGFFARFVSRLPVGRKLLLIYLLDLTAVIYISGILINEKYIAIDFARKELAGNAYIAQVRDTLLALPVPLGTDSDGPSVDPAQIQRWIAGAAAAEAAYGQGMRSADTSEALGRALRDVADHPRIDGARFTAVLDASRALITRIGNQSNMILDPDLDSYYTMSLLLLRYPELDELLARTAQQAVAASGAEGVEQERVGTRLLILEGRFDAVVKGMETDYAEAITAGPPELRAALDASHDALKASLLAFRGQTDKVRALQGSGDSQRPAATNESGRDVALQHARAVASLRVAWQAASTSLDALVQTRIDHLLGRMWLHFGTAAVLLLVLLSLVYFVARQISRPIRALSRVADQVSGSGDYAMRAAHDSPDEIGQLVSAFNGMLGELDRNRVLREDVAGKARAEEAQRALVTALPMPLLVTSIPDHRVLHANEPALPWIEGVTADPWAAFLEPQARARFFQSLADLGSVDGFEVRWQTGPDAAGRTTTQWALLSGRQLVFQGRNALLTAFTPISRIKLLEQRLQLWAKVFEASSESIVIFDAERHFLTANQAFFRATGWDAADVSGQSPAFFLSEGRDPMFFQAAWQILALRGSWQGEVDLRRKDGRTYAAWLVANAVRGQDGTVSHFVAASVDITDRKSSEARIRHLAHHDVLTDLPNRALCMERLRLAVEHASRHGEQVGVVFIDLDRFKLINDSMGHHVGDALLRSVAKRLLQSVRADDTVSRLGGDEFVVVLNHIESLAQLRELVSDRMIPLVGQPHVIDGVELNVACSAGIAVFPQDGHDIDHLMRHADAAMYQAKSGGRNQALFFAPEFHAQAKERHLIENALRQVAQRGELQLHFQPRIEARSGHVVGVEALLRWQHPEQGLIPPDRFIKIAEETGHILPMGAWVIDEACRQHAAWRQEGLGEISISVNVSALQLRDLALPRLLDAALREHRVAPEMIELELTETSLMDHAVGTVEILKTLKALGVTLAIDDFGTGYSSLNYLHQFPIDKLKIDQSFVRDMLTDPADRAITQAIIGLGHTLGLQVVAEGVERADEESLLRSFGCDELQGYLYARPMPAADLRKWLTGRVVATSRPPLQRRIVQEVSLENA